MSKQPPRFLFRLFRWYCDPYIVDDIEGDLLERYQRHYRLRRFRNWLLFRDIILLFRPGIIRSLGGHHKLNHFGMLNNYFKITWRSLLRQKLYAFINIGGLAIGIASFLLILLYIQHERSYDQFYPNAENIYNIYQRQVGNSSLGSDYYAVTPAALTPALLDRYPEVEAATSIGLNNTLLLLDENRYVENTLFVDEYYFDVFSHNFLEGDPKVALKNEKGAVVTASFALKVFGTLDVLNKPIEFWGDKKAFITAVIEDQPNNASIQFSCILSLHASSWFKAERVKTEWSGNDWYTFFSLNHQADPKQLENKLPEVLADHWIKGKTPGRYIVSALADLHLRNNINSDLGVKGNSRQLTMFSVIAVIVLILACVNYMNLAIARSIKRAKEVGLRKAIGAGKRQLVFQFLCESVLLSFISVILALFLLQSLTPLFGNMVERALTMSMIYDLGLIPWMLLLVFAIGIVSGSYPALFMSSLQPVLVLKGKVDIKKGNNLQRSLIILQYVVSIVMITVCLVVYQQMKFIQDKDLGFSKDQVLTIEMRSSETINQISALRTIFNSNVNTSQVSFSSSLPTNIQSSTFLNDDRSGGNIYRINVDESFQSVYHIELLAGRFISDEIDNESKKNFVLNETAAKALGFSAASAIGQTFKNEEGELKNIIGVVKDFHMHSMHIPVAPLMMTTRPWRRYISIKVNPVNIRETLRFVEKTMADHSPFPFNYQFIDDRFNELYQRDTREAEILGFFTVLAILIACLGLFGMAAFTASQRTKEIGLRKVLGASMEDIILLFSKQFMSLILLALIIAIPVSQYLSEQWLEGFAYCISVEWYVYLLGGLVAMILAFATLSSQSVKVSLINPVDSLKDE